MQQLNNASAMNSMSDNLTVLDEPRLEFRYGQGMVDPHDGLSLFGPYDAGLPSQPKNISYGLIGTPRGIELFDLWAHKILGPIYPEPGLDEKIWPMYPGFEAAFACLWPDKPSRTFLLNEENLINAARQRDPYRRVFGVVEQYLEAISVMHKRDEPIDAMICVVPEIVYTNCRPLSRVYDGIGYPVRRRILTERQRGQLDIFDDYAPEIYSFSVDFRRQIKARAMAYDIPTQIIRDSALRLTPRASMSERGLTPLCDRAWNLSVALYYKAGGKPWRLRSAREGVCYIGIAYRKKDQTPTSQAACCAAQMFLDTGDGIVFMGAEGPWYSPKHRDFHLNRDAAKELLTGVLRTYNELEGKKLKEIFLHCRSNIDDEEFSGFEDACPEDVRLIGVRVKQERFGMRLFREGTRPVIRGTFWEINPRAGFLWASGFKPRLGTYDGWEIPLPLRIDIQHGEAHLHQVATDILGLTKLNYNACHLGESNPVTIKFSDAVGEILVSNPTVKDRSPKFKFYI